jgi:hypothetical protein
MERRCFMVDGTRSGAFEKHATCTNTMILGGRYQQSMIKGNMMGMPFEGMGLLGYDNAQKLFYSTWVDNMGTGCYDYERHLG